MNPLPLALPLPSLPLIFVLGKLTERVTGYVQLRAKLKPECVWVLGSLTVGIINPLAWHHVLCEIEKRNPPPGWLTTLSCDPSSWWEEVLGNWGAEDLADVIYAYGHRCLGGCNINYQSASCKLLGLQPAARNVHIISNLLRIYVPCDMKGNPGTLAKKACTFLGSNCGYTGNKGVRKTYRQVV